LGNEGKWSKVYDFPEAAKNVFINIQIQIKWEELVDEVNATKIEFKSKVVC